MNKKRLEKKLRDVHYVNKMKAEGSNCGRNEIYKMKRRFYDENEDIIEEAQREQRVLRMKSFYTKRNWSWPPKSHISAGIAHDINKFYGKEVCKHSPKKKQPIKK